MDTYDSNPRRPASSASASTSARAGRSATPLRPAALPDGFALDRQRPAQGLQSRFLMIWYTCCGQYGRATRNLEGSHYVGHCPRCSRRIQARIGPDGTRRRAFRTTG